MKTGLLSFIVLSGVVQMSCAAEYHSENRDAGKLINLGEMTGFYRYRQTMDSKLASAAYMIHIPEFLCDESLDLPYQRKAGLKEDDKEIFMGDGCSTVRLLGGWIVPKGKTIEDVKPEDLFYRDRNGQTAYRWNLLYARLDPLIERGYDSRKITLVLDNVPFDMVEEGKIDAWKYGQITKPESFKEWGEFIRQLCIKLKENYGEEIANGFRFRIGTEMQNHRRFKGTQEEYFKLYDYAAAAIEEVLPGAQVGPFNRCNHKGIEEVVSVKNLARHCAEEPNFATGRVGTPFDFIAHSFYYVPVGDEAADAIRHPDDFIPELQKFYEDVKSVSPKYKNTPLEIHEFGPLVTEGKLVGYDTGVRGAAQVLETMVDLRKIGTDKVWHWYISERIKPEPVVTLIHGYAWLYCIFDYMRGGESWKLPFDITGGYQGNSVETFASVKDDATYVMVSCWSVDRKKGAPCEVEVTIPTSVVRFRGELEIGQILFDESSSVYDVIWSDFKDAGLLSRRHLKHLREYGKAVTFAQNSCPHVMCEDNPKAGAAFIRKNRERYEDLMKQSLTLSEFTGELDRGFWSTKLRLTLPSPSVYVIRIKGEDR